MDSKTFIQSVASGEVSKSKETLENLLASKAFQALDDKKQQIAKTIYNGGQTATEDEIEVQDTEDTEVQQ
jgi:hypothetical protein